MIIGIPKEIKEGEYRVSAVPAVVESLVHASHEVVVEADAGRGTAIADHDYVEAGARMVDKAEDVYSAADMIVKVKEPLPQEHPLIREGQVIFTFFHFAASRELTQAMIDRKAVCIAYETIEESGGSLPILTPMSEVAGRMAIHEGAKYLERPMEGRGILLGGVPGVAPANVAIIGGGVAGSNAAKMAAGLGANVKVLDVNLERLRYLDDIMPQNVTTIMSDSYNLRLVLREADLVVGAVLRHGARTPVLVTRKMLKLMKPRAVIVDIAVDQGGIFETTHPTTHTNPVYMEEGIVHYCVANMPGAVAGTSTYALTNVTGRYMLQLADKGWKKALEESPELRKGLNIAYGKVTLPAIAKMYGYPETPVEQVLG
ncbi:MAG: alanine dehydrogenase [Armatimonadetes bacterium]|nr:alanine dehydrogenase [Armatimonadota bacterium]